jgi:hypothetical protein
MLYSYLDMSYYVSFHELQPKVWIHFVFFYLGRMPHPSIFLDLVALMS